MTIKGVAVVGAGTMGSQIALQTAVSGLYDVFVVDENAMQLERARDQAQKLVTRAVERGRLEERPARASLDRLEFTTDLDRAASLSDLVIEAVFEDLGVKRELFQRLDEKAPPDAILASNSSTIAISRLADATGRPDRCLNLHFFHPVTVMELCEVVRGPETSDETVATAMEFVRSIGRIPVLIRKEVHGFIVNRILIAAVEEAMALLEGGVATVEDIDTAVKKGLNWPMGPFELLDFSGLDIFYGALRDRQQLGEGSGPSRILTEKVEAGQVGRKAGKGFYDYSSGG